MNELAHVCIACAAEFRSPAELAEHLSNVHAPQAGESELELARRLGVYTAHFETAPSLIEAFQERSSDLSSPADELLRTLRADAAVAIAERDRLRMLELTAELLAIAKMAEGLAAELTRRARVARETHGTIERVIELLGESDP